MKGVNIVFPMTFAADIKHIPKPYADAQRPGLHYLATKDTPTVGRSVDDFHPRVQLKAIFREDNSFFDNPDNITDTWLLKTPSRCMSIT